MDSIAQKRDSHRTTGATALLEFSKIVAYDLGYNTDNIYWTTDLTHKNKQHTLTLINGASVITIFEIGDQQLINYVLGIGAEIIRDSIRLKLLSQKELTETSPS